MKACDKCKEDRPDQEISIWYGSNGGAYYCCDKCRPTIRDYKDFIGTEKIYMGECDVCFKPAIGSIYDNKLGKMMDVCDACMDHMIERDDQTDEHHISNVEIVKNMLKYLPEVKKIIYKPHTTVLHFKDKTKSVVKLHNSDSYDLEKAILWAYAKHHSKKAKVERDYKYYYGSCSFTI